jgi:hypothetical protein
VCETTEENIMKLTALTLLAALVAITFVVSPEFAATLRNLPSSNDDLSL